MHYNNNKVMGAQSNYLHVPEYPTNDEDIWRIDVPAEESAGGDYPFLGLKHDWTGRSTGRSTNARSMRCRHNVNAGRNFRGMPDLIRDLAENKITRGYTDLEGLRPRMYFFGLPGRRHWRESEQRESQWFHRASPSESAIGSIFIVQ